MSIAQPVKPVVPVAGSGAVTKVGVGLEEIRVSTDPNVILACMGLGSCIAACGYDPVARVGGMAHIVLPDSGGKEKEGSPGKFADTGIPRLIEAMKEAGALKSRIALKMAGGARIFANVKEGSLLDIGFRNLAAVRLALVANSLELRGENTGGTHGRSLLLHISTGLTQVTSALKDTVEL